MLTDCLPFVEASETDDYFKFVSGSQPEDFWTLYEQEGHTYSPALRDLLTLMFQHHESDRPDLAAVMAHPWVQGFTPSCLEVKEELEFRKHRESRQRETDWLVDNQTRTTAGSLS